MAPVVFFAKAMPRRKVIRELETVDFGPLGAVTFNREGLDRGVNAERSLIYKEYRRTYAPERYESQSWPSRNGASIYTYYELPTLQRVSADVRNLLSTSIIVPSGEIATNYTALLLSAMWHKYDVARKALDIVYAGDWTRTPFDRMCRIAAIRSILRDIVAEVEPLRIGPPGRSFPADRFRETLLAIYVNYDALSPGDVHCYCQFALEQLLLYVTMDFRRMAADYDPFSRREKKNWVEVRANRLEASRKSTYKRRNKDPMMWKIGQKPYRSRKS